MADRIVINASPLIAFGQMQFFHIAAQMPFEFVCPVEVADEIAAGNARGYPVNLPAWLTALPLAAPLSPFALATLDAGEAAVIQLAIEQNIQTVCIDDLKGRRASVAVGLRVVGSLGLLGKAKTLGLISVVRPFLERAQKRRNLLQPEASRSVLKIVGRINLFEEQKCMVSQIEREPLAYQRQQTKDFNS